MIDSRGFKYPLLAVLNRQRWQLDQRRHELAVALQGRQDANERLRRLQDMMRAASRPAAGNRLDPVQAQALLGFLCQLDDRIKAQLAECESMNRHCEELRRAAIDSQCRLEAMENHCETLRSRFVMDQSRIQAALSDQEWMANWHRGVMPEMGGEQ